MSIPITNNNPNVNIAGNNATQSISTTKDGRRIEGGGQLINTNASNHTRSMTASSGRNVRSNIVINEHTNENRQIRDGNMRDVLAICGFAPNKAVIQAGTPAQSAQAAMQTLLNKAGINKKVGEGYGRDLANYHFNSFGQSHATMRGAMRELNNPIVFIKSDPTRIYVYENVNGKMRYRMINPDDIATGKEKIPANSVCLYKTPDGQFGTVDRRDDTTRISGSDTITKQISGGNTDCLKNTGINTSEVTYNTESPRESARQSLQTVISAFGHDKTKSVGDKFAYQFAHMKPDDKKTARTILNEIGRPFAIVEGNFTHVYTINENRKVVHLKHRNNEMDKKNLPYNTVVFYKDPEYGIGLTGRAGELDRGSLRAKPKQETTNAIESLGFVNIAFVANGTTEDSAHYALTKLTGLNNVPIRFANALDNYKYNSWGNPHKLFKTLTNLESLRGKPILFTKEGHDGEPTRVYSFRRDKDNNFIAEQLELNPDGSIKDPKSIPENAVAIAKIDGHYTCLTSRNNMVKIA